ncbi:exodeoxyribonuclease VII large subunit [Oceanibacterium hippocampi]|uniref:Exodeoxyribonuclease 7 large subunit n=1 Tax=Oceanibacterium hippocampi TaxID=745714 RepID=A0A1Y5S5N4_9PROT|nr:exodeoxyribonuclease VII large subunit [Oceanibacterium hippocampi]SLN33044.1 Exodeoxyribonuclease 7 large subunit [Oceanibacterium hippocampi]
MVQPPDIGTDAGANPGNVHEYSVSEISSRLKRTVEDAYDHVRVRGELSGFKRAASGHLYMALKDDQAVLDAVCWRGNAGRLTFRPEDGLEVVCTGKLTTYPGRSKYQLVVERMEPAGVGALMALLEQRRQKLAAEGLFEEGRKRPLPYLPAVIGVVTSPTGAVIRDILHRLADRFPRHVLVWPVQVQGDAAAGQVATAIRGFNRLETGGRVPRPDVLIVARGGGSIEDLWAFNEEVVVRAIAGSAIPVISAVGHETDTTLADHAADRRAPTPTAAAEMAVPVRSELRLQIQSLDGRMLGAMSRRIAAERQRLDGFGRGLRDPESTIATARQRLDELDSRLRVALRGRTERGRRDLAAIAGRLSRPLLLQRLEQRREKLARLAADLDRDMQRRRDDRKRALDQVSRLLESFSYRKTLERGFALVRDGGGAPLKRRAAARAGEQVTIEFLDGTVPAALLDGDAGEPARKAKPARPRKTAVGGDSTPEQGSLL